MCPSSALLRFAYESLGDLRVLALYEEDRGERVAQAVEDEALIGFAQSPRTVYL
jgi:hypothetical protein